jgi:ferredoxin
MFRLRNLIILGVLIVWFWAEKWRPILPSTIAAIRKSGLKNILNGRAPHGYFYGRWIPQYLIILQKLIPKFGPKGKKWLGDTYHGKVLPHELAKAIVTLDKNIPLQDLGTKIIPYPIARDFVLDANPDIVVTECGCRAISGNDCKPSQVCMAIGKPFSDFILEHRPHLSRRITQEEALKILEEVHNKGWVHNGFFKDVTLNAFYAICNCCPCCCTGVMAMKHGIDMVCASGYQAKVNDKLCKGCETCVKICPFNAVTVVNGKAIVNLDKCMGCGVCVTKCPNNARELKLGGKLDPLDVRKLKEA